MNDDERAGLYFDKMWSASLERDGLPVDGIELLRAGYIKSAVAAPTVVAKLRELYPDEATVADGGWYRWSADGSVQQMTDGMGPVRTWEVTRSLVLTKGAIGNQFDKELALKGVRMVARGNNKLLAYSFFGYVEAVEAFGAVLESARVLDELLRPYEVEYFVYRTSVSVKGF